MSRANRFDDSRNMSEMQFERFQQELDTLREKLNEREQQLAFIGQQGQNQVAQLQAQLQDVFQQLGEREQEIAQLQIHVADIPIEPAAAPTSNDDFARGRVPDIIKGLPQYSGSLHQLNTWIQSVDRILNHFKSLAKTDIYQLWLQEIRNKIVGEAGDMLASNGIPLDWPTIKSQLILLYGDKRELSTLLQKLFSLKQERFSVNEFYANIRDCFTGISTHIQTSQEWEKPAEIVRFVDKLCLEKFIDGLEEPFATHVGLMQPTTLNQAFQHAMEKANKIARKNGEYDLTKTHQKPTLPQRSSVPFNNHKHPQYPPYKPLQPFQQRLPQRPNYPKPPQQPYFKLPSNPGNHPQPLFQPYRQFNQPPNRPPYQQQYYRPNFQPPPHQNTHQKVEPMEVDRSIRSRNINYINRPNFHLEHLPVECENYYEYDAYYSPEQDEQNYYSPEQAEQNQEQTDHITKTTQHTAETSESAKNHEAIDDLNFHIARGLRETT